MDYLLPLQHLVQPNSLMMFAIGLVMVGLFAFSQPARIRDDFLRRLPYQRTARMKCVVRLSAIYIAVTLMLSLTEFLPVEFRDQCAKQVIPYVSQQAPFLALFGVGALLQLEPFRTAERKYILRVHDIKPPKLFLSYRREDTAVVAGRIFDWICASFPKSEVFMDVENTT